MAEEPHVFVFDRLGQLVRPAQARSSIDDEGEGGAEEGRPRDDPRRRSRSALPLHALPEPAGLHGQVSIPLASVLGSSLVRAGQLRIGQDRTRVDACDDGVRRKKSSAGQLACALLD